MRPVDLTGRPLGICKVATRYRVNPCPTPPLFSTHFFSYLRVFLLGLARCRHSDGNFCHENRHFSPQQAELRLPREDEWQRWMVAGPPASSPPQEPRKTYCFALETSSINLAWTLNLILDQDRTIRSSLVAGRTMEGYQSFKVVRKKQL